MLRNLINFAREKRSSKLGKHICESMFYRVFVKKFWYRFAGYYGGKSSQNAIAFYSTNAERVSNVSNMISDEKSKKTYLSMVKYRQTGKSKDFPFDGCEEHTQYFIKELKFGNDEVFIDCGAFDGDTVDKFLKHCPDFRKIVAFEPFPKTFEILKKKHGNNPKITLINACVSDKNGKAQFSSDEFSYSSKIIEESTSSSFTVETKTIDSLDLEKVTFIKMDIEGAEYEALKGAEKTILKDKPKLAICIYHSDEDMIRLAEYINGLVPEYKFHVRVHEFCGPNEIVLYAIFPE